MDAATLSEGFGGACAEAGKTKTGGDSVMSSCMLTEKLLGKQLITIPLGHMFISLG